MNNIDLKLDTLLLQNILREYVQKMKQIGLTPTLEDLFDENVKNYEYENYHKLNFVIQRFSKSQIKHIATPIFNSNSVKKINEQTLEHALLEKLLNEYAKDKIELNEKLDIDDINEFVFNLNPDISMIHEKLSYIIPQFPKAQVRKIATRIFSKYK